MNTIRNWFTPSARERLYTAIAALAPILVTAGILLPGQIEPILAIVAAALQGFAGILALSNLKATEAARWFGTVGRGIIYSGATVVAGAVVTLGIVSGDWANTALQYTSFGLTALAAVLAVITPKEVTVLPDEIAKVDAVVVDDAVISADQLVIDGALVADAIKADTITPAFIQQNTIDASQIATGTISADQLVVSAPVKEVEVKEVDESHLFDNEEDGRYDK